MSTSPEHQMLEDTIPVARQTGDRSPIAVSSEAVLRRGSWRERAAGGAGAGGAASGLSAGFSSAPGSAEDALQWHPPLSFRQRLTRAVSVPAAAGAAVFVVVVIIAIVITVVQSGSAVDTANGAAKTPAAAEDPESVVSKRAEETAPASKLLVHVVGEVAKPGVVELPAGSRVTEAIDAAGGATSKAALGALNLARVLTDGEQLVVPNTDQATAGAQTSQTPGAGGASGAEGTTAGGLVNLNTADAAQLEALPRIGPALAQRIVEWREANGPFVNVDQLMEVSGVGAKIFEGLKAEVTV